jgi:hypothetical protein
MRHASTLLGGTLCFLAVGASSSAWARGRYVSDEEEAKAGFGFELLQFDVGVLQPNLSNVVFQGDGLLNGSPAHQRTVGRDAGIRQPLLTTLGGRFTFRFLHWLMAGGYFERVGGSLDQFSAVQANGQGLGDSLGGVDLGGHVGLVWSPGYYEVRLDTDIGARLLSVDIERFDTETCSNKGATYSCQPAASSTKFELQPKLQLGVHLGPWVTVGAYGGVDSFPQLGWSAGGWAALHAPFWAPDLVRLQ